MGQCTLADGESYVLTLGTKLYTHNSFINNADYKTALIRGQGCIPSHSMVLLGFMIVAKILINGLKRRIYS